MQLRLSLRTAALTFAVLLPVSSSFVLAQAGGNAKPQSPAPQAPTPQTPSRGSEPISSLEPSGNDANPFPKPDPRNFTADSPTAETVSAFLHESWGYDTQRIWQVQAILKTAVPGVSKVVVLVAQKGAKAQVASLQFFTLPDGKHLIADDVLPFGPKPFAENRKLMQERATGPARGSASKDLLMVEFADFQCPHCKDAQPTIEKLMQEFPNARFVYENYPLVQIHSEAYKAAAYGVCVAKEGGNDAFFKYSAAVYDAQANLTPAGSDEVLKGAVTKAGLDPAKVAACSTSAETRSAIDASTKLAQEMNINQTPTLVVNGRALPLSSVPVETLVQLIHFQATEDGVASAPAK
ncbi:MAG TPA: thioredoxin domain-containing protein [Acidisarcina sp.]|nr:thioredoxin domain-containing protein [Acidisarcina sp.]